MDDIMISLTCLCLGAARFRAVKMLETLLHAGPQLYKVLYTRCLALADKRQGAVTAHVTAFPSLIIELL